MISMVTLTMTLVSRPYTLNYITQELPLRGTLFYNPKVHIVTLIVTSTTKSDES